MTEHGILGGPVAVASAGVALLADELERQGVTVERIGWRPPAAGGGPALATLAPKSPITAAANDDAVERMQSSRPLLTGVGVARDLLAEMTPQTLLHAGPPIEWAEMCGPLRGAIVGAALYEGLASDPADAERKAAAGAFEFSPCHGRGAVGPMAGVISASMPVWIVENDTHGNRAFATLNEGLGKVLRYGAYGSDVLERLLWMRDVLAPLLQAALDQLGRPIDLRALTAQALEMGDECHNRNRAATSLLLRDLLPGLVESGESSRDVADVARFIAGNDHFYLNLSMPAAKVAADAAAGIAGSSIVTAMARNGTEFGLRLSGTGERWFTGPSGVVDGLYLPGFGPGDANPDIGDSTITETVGLGGMAMAAAPAIVKFVGGDAERALASTVSMYDITWAESSSYRIPALGFRGTPVGIDCREVVHTGLLPVVNTGIAHREPGVGQVGAGIVEPPMGAFVAAVGALAAEDPRA
ncbi:MAG: YlbE family protein [Solirubrobacteraceae bacterium]